MAEKIKFYTYELGRVNIIEVDRYTEASFWISGKRFRRFTQFSSSYPEHEGRAFVKDVYTKVTRSMNLDIKKRDILNRKIDKAKKSLEEFEALAAENNFKLKIEE